MSYKNIFKHVQERDGSLSATEAFAVDVIYLMGTPTITEFADYIGISQPNATYKVNNLVEKGYLKKIHSLTDKRECHLEVTGKFIKYYVDYTDDFFKSVADIEKRFTKEEIENFHKVMDAVLKIDC